MRYEYSGEDINNLDYAEKTCFLLTNGRGGFSSLCASGGVARGDQAILMAALKAPNVRWNMVSTSVDEINISGVNYILSSQRMADESKSLCGHEYLASFEYDECPIYTYEIDDVTVRRMLVMPYGENTTIVKYEVTNPKGKSIKLSVSPVYRITPKNDAYEATKEIVVLTQDEHSVAVRCDYAKNERNNSTTSDNQTATDNQTVADSQTAADNQATENVEYVTLTMASTGRVTTMDKKEAGEMFFTLDERDGRFATGSGAIMATTSVEATDDTSLTVIYTTEDACKWTAYADKAFDMAAVSRKERTEKLIASSGLTSELGCALVEASDAYVVDRESTNGKTIIAGYPFFEDWGRDTMIALAGTTMVTGRFEDCKNILRTFAKYSKNGLLPNLFPEGDAVPMYNTVDAPLLFINSVYEYVQASGDEAFIEEIFDVLDSTIKAYSEGSEYGIHCDEDGLIAAGLGTWQLTWMDVCVEGFLPTPRHGKPVEINAYWYSALRVMAEFANKLGKSEDEYLTKANKAMDSFTKLYPSPNGGLKDVLSGKADENQIRPNQIWALTMPFTMLDSNMIDEVLDIVERELYTTVGLRTLNMDDKDFHEVYIGPMVSRDRAYHQGTVWTFPLGAFLRAKIRRMNRYRILDENKYLAEKEFLEDAFLALTEWLKEGCVNQLAEIYDGKRPTESRGCFAQAWSVGEILRAVSEWERACALEQSLRASLEAEQ